MVKNLVVNTKVIQITPYSADASLGISCFSTILATKIPTTTADAVHNIPLMFEFILSDLK